MKKSKKSFWRRVFAYRRLRSRGPFVFLSIPSSQTDPATARLPKLLTIQQTAELLRVHPNTLREWDRLGKLRAVRLGSRRDRRYVRERVLELHLAMTTTRTTRLRSTMVEQFEKYRQAWRRLAIGAGAAVIIAVSVTITAQAVAETNKQPDQSVSPTTCVGWRNPNGAKQPISRDNSGAAISSADVQAAAGQVGANLLNAVDPSLTCRDFRPAQTIDQLEIENVGVSFQLKLEAKSASRDVYVAEWSTDGDHWQFINVAAAGNNQDQRISRQLGRLSAEEIRQLQFRIRYEGDPSGQGSSARLADLKLTLSGSLKSADGTVDRAAHQKLDRLVDFSQDAYLAEEPPVITVPRNRPRRALFWRVGVDEWEVKSVALRDAQGREKKISPISRQSGSKSSLDTQLTFDMRSEHPGLYTAIVQVRTPAGTIEKIERRFAWGVAALNITHAVARPGVTQVIGMGVLDDSGKTICDAEVKLTVKDPKGKTRRFSTTARTVQTSGVCVDKGVTNKPDYFVPYVVEHPGTYHLRMEATTKFGERVVEENFLSDPAIEFDVDRFDYPTRIYPPAKYPVRLAVTPTRDYSGLVWEQVPTSFTVTSVSADGQVRIDPDDPTRRRIEWLVDWKRGETQYLGYEFDAPDISPALFFTGPITIGGSFTEGPLFREPRQWQIASDTVTPTGTLGFSETAQDDNMQWLSYTSATTFTDQGGSVDTTTNANDLLHVVVKNAPTRNELMAGQTEINGTMHITRRDSSAVWSEELEVAGVTATQACDTSAGACNLGFNMAYEQLGGRAIVFYGKAANDGILYYNIWNGTSWAGEASTTFRASSTFDTRFVVAKPEQGVRSNRILVMVSDAENDIYAMIFDGGTPGDLTTITGTSSNTVSKNFDGDWEGTTRNAVVFWAEAESAVTNPYRYKVYTNGTDTWDSSASDPGNAHGAANIGRWINVAAHKRSNRLAVILMGSASDTRPAIWKNDDSTAGLIFGNEDALAETPLDNWGDVEWENYNGGTPVAMFVYSANAGNADASAYQTWTSGTGFSNETDMPLAMGDDSAMWKLYASPNSDEMMGVGIEWSDDLCFQRWSGTGWASDCTTTEYSTTLPPDSATTHNEQDAFDFSYTPYSPWSRNWKFYAGTDTATTPTVNLANENVTPTGFDAAAGKFRLRFSVAELGGLGQNDSRKKLQYTTGTPDDPASTWTDVDDPAGGGIWRYVDCDGGDTDCNDGQALGGTVLSGTPAAGWWTTDKDAAATTSMDHTAETVRELEYSVEANSAAAGTTYYFRMYDINDNQAPVLREQDNDGANDCATAACTYPSLTTATPGITVSGGCFTDETEGTPCSDDGSDQIKVAVNGTPDAGVDATVDGSWSFTINTPANGAILVFYRDGEATEGEEATTVVKYDGSGNVDGVKMYQSQLVIGTDSGSANTDQTIAVSDLNTGANGYENSDDEDVLLDYTAGADLTVDAEGTHTEQLYIISGDTYRPASGGGSDTTTHHLEIDSTAVITADSNAFNVAGDWTNAGTFTANTSTVTLNGTAADQAILSSSYAFNDLVINNTASLGSDDIIIDDPFTVSGALTITDGNFDLATNDVNFSLGGSLSIGTNGRVTKAASSSWLFNGTGTSTWTDSSSPTQDLGTVVIDGTTKTVNLGSSVRATKLTVTDTFGLASSGYTLTLTGTGQAASKPLTVTGTLNEGTNSTVDYIGNGATDVTRESYWNLSVRPGGVVSHHAEGGGTLTVLGSLTVGDGSNAGTFNLDTNDPTVDVNGGVTIATSGTFVGSATAGMTVGAGWSNSGTFTGTGGTITFDDTAGSNTLAGGIGNMIINASGVSYSTNAVFTVTGSYRLQAGSFTQGANNNMSVSGNFTLDNGTTWTKASGSGTLTFNGDLTFTDGNATKQDLGAVIIGTSPDTTNLASDMAASSLTINAGDVLNTKGYEVDLSGTFTCVSTCTLDMTDTAGEGDGTIFTFGGNWDVQAGTATITPSTTSRVEPDGTADQTITTQGKAFHHLYINNTGAGGSDDIIIAGTLDVNGTLTINDGDLDLAVNDPNVTTAGDVTINTNGLVTKADNGTATWTFDGTGTNSWTDGSSAVQDIGLVTINGTTKTINMVTAAKATKLTIATGQTFGLGSSGYTFTLTGSGQTTARPFQNSGTLNEGTNSTFKFTGTSAIDIDTETFYHLTLAPSGVGGPTYYIDPGEVGTTSVTGNLVMGDTSNAVTVDGNGIKNIDVGGDLTISTGATFTYGSDNTVTVGGSFTNNGTNTDTGQGIAFDGTATGKTISGSLTGSNKFISLFFNGSGGEWTSNGAVEVDGLAMSAGTWTGSGDVTINFNATGTAGVINRTGGTFTVRPSGGQNFGPTTASTTWTFNDLTFGNSHASAPLTITTQNCSSCIVAVGGVLRVGKTGDAAGATTTLTGATSTWNLTGTSADPFILLSSPAGAFTANTSTVNYNGVNGSGNVNITTTNYSGLGCSPGSAEILDVAGSFTVSALLTIGTNCSYTIAGSQTTTLSANTGTSLTLNGILTGTGRLTYQNSATTFPTSGTISGGILRFDMVNGSMTMPVRTDYRAVEAYNGSGAAKFLTPGTTAAPQQTLTMSSHLHIYADSAFNTTFEANTYDPIINIGGDVDFLGTGGGSETVSAGAGTWTVSGNVNITDGFYSNTTGNTLIMNGTGGKTITPNNASLYNFTIDPPSAATINISTSNVAVTNNLVVADGDSLNINGVTLDMDNTTTCSVNLNTTGTITSAIASGTFWYGCSAAFPSGGTVSNYWLLPNATNTDLTFPGRSFTGSPTTVWFYNTGASNRVVTLGTAGGQTFSATGDVRVFANSTGNITIDASANSPDYSGTNIDFVKNSTGIPALITGGGTYTFSGNVNMTNGTVTASTNNTIVMSGASKTLTTAGNSLYNYTVSAGSTTMSGTTTLNNDLTVSGGTLTAPSSGALNVAGDFVNDATFVHNSSTVTLNGTTSTTLDTGCVTVTTCTNEDLYSLVINKTAGAGANDNVTLTSTGLRVANTLTVTAGELVQGALNVQVDTGGSVSVGAAGIWTNISTGDLFLGGGFSNAGSVTFSSSNAAQCTDVADDIVIDSTVDNTLRTWSGAGTYVMRNINVDDMSDGAITITIYTSTKSGDTDWTVGSCGITFSGTVYQSSNEGSAFDCTSSTGGQLDLVVAVNGDVTPDTGICNAVGGTFSFSVSDPGGADVPIALYVANTESEKATTVTLSASGGSNITGISLMLDRVLVSQESGTATTNAHLGTADNGNSGVRYAVSGGNLTVESGMELHVLSSKTFTPGGTVTTAATGTAAGPAGDLHIAGVLTMGTNALNVGGDYTNAGTFNKTNTQTTTLEATGSGFTITPGTGDFNNLTVSGNGGGDGTYTLSGANLTVDGTLTVNTGDTLTIDTGRILTNTGATDVNNDGTINGSGTLQFTSASGGPDTDANSTGTYSAVTRYNATSGSIASTTFDARTYSGRVELYQDSTTAANRTVTPSTNGTYTLSGASSHLYLINDDAAQTLTLAGGSASAVFTIGGDLDFTGTGGSSEIIQSGNDIWTVGGNVNFTDGTYTATSGNELIMSGTASLTNTNNLYKLTINGSGNTVTTGSTFSVTNTLTIGGAADSNNDTFTIDGAVTSTNISTVTIHGSGTDTINGSGQLTMRNGNLSDPSANGVVSVDVLFDSQNSGFTAPARAYGGDVTFDDQGALGGNDITLGGPTWTVGGNMTFNCTVCEIGTPIVLDGSVSNPAINISGSFSVNDFSAATLNMGSGTWTVVGSFSVLTLGNLNHNSGTLVMNGTGSFSSNGFTFNNFTTSGSGSVTLASATHTFAGNLNLGSGVTLNPQTSTVILSGATKTIDGGGKSLNILTVSGSYTIQNTDLTVGSTLTVNGTLSGNRSITASAGVVGSGTINLSGGTFTQRVAAAQDFGQAGNANNWTFSGLSFTNSSGVDRTITAKGSGQIIVGGTLTIGDAGDSNRTSFDNETNDRVIEANGAVALTSKGTLLASSTAAFNVAGAWTLTSGGVFTAGSGTVTLDGAAQQTVTGTMTGSNTFNHLIVTNNSGTDPDSSPSVIFAGAADTAGTFTAATNNVKLRFNAGSTYSLAAINFSGSAGNLVYIRSSTPGTAAALSAGAGSRTVTYTAIKDSDACGSTGGAIDASDGTNRDDGNTPCWLINKITVSLSGQTVSLGTLSTSNVSYRGVTSTITTNAGTGYMSLVKYDQTLTAPGGSIADAGGDVDVDPGSSEFGASTSKSGQTIVQSNASPACSTSLQTQGTAAAATALSTTFQSFASSVGAATNDATTLCLLSSVSGTQASGEYQSTLTIVTTARY